MTDPSASSRDLPARGRWTRAQVEELGVTTDVATAASVLGIGRSTAYELIRRGEFPVRVLRIGTRMQVPVATLLEALGHTAADRQHDRSAS